MIRPMTVEDIGYIQHIAHVTWNDTYAGIIPEDIQIDFYQTLLFRCHDDETHGKDVLCLLLNVKKVLQSVF